MKGTKTLFLIGFLAALTGCFDSPKFGNTPKIEYKNIYFGYAPTPSKLDSLVVELSFEDGDGDLGLGDEYRNFPFHEYDLFLRDENSINHTVRIGYSSNASQTAYVEVPEQFNGKLVRLGDLPDLPPDNCENYKQLDVLVKGIDTRIFDESYTSIEQGNDFLVSGKFLIETNRNNKNIFVKFFRNLSPGNPDTWEEYVWPFCQTFDGRFTTLADEPTPLSGTMRYTMSSFGFASIMGNPEVAWRMEFTVMDRALRESNTVSTQPFLLQEITR
jgi:hypothetical protein